MVRTFVVLFFAISSSSVWSVSSWDCPATRFEAKLEGEVILYKDLLSQDTQSVYRSAIFEQFNYLHGLSANVLTGKTVLSPPSNINIKRISEISSTEELLVHESLVSEDASDYIKRALKLKKLPANSSQQKIQFDLTFNLVTCMSEKELKASLGKLQSLPADPFLAYWYVGEKEFRERNYLNISKARVNPCARAELADLPQANYFWYFWNPEISPLCQKSYSKHSVQADIKFIRKPLTEKEDPLTVNRVSIVHGIVEQHFLPGSMSKIAGQVRRLMQSGNPDKDPEFFYVGEDEARLFSVLKHLKLRKAVLTSVNQRGNHLEIELKTQEKEFSIFFGETDYFGLRPPQHQAFFQSVLSDSDMVIYWGHAGLGKNFTFSTLGKGRAHTLALLSCYSYRYVDEEKLRNLPSLRRLVATGNDLVEGDRVIINLLDRSVFLTEPSQDKYSSFDFTFVTQIKEKYESI